MIGNTVPEGDGAWTILMDLKDIVELVLSPTFDDASIQYLQTKIQDHRHMLQEVFPEFTLLPKHHYVEHYPDLSVLGLLSICGLCGLRANTAFSSM